MLKKFKPEKYQGRPPFFIMSLYWVLRGEDNTVPVFTKVGAVYFAHLF